MKIHELRVGTKVKIRFKSSLDTVMCDGVITDDSKEYSIQVRIAEKGLNLQKVVNGSENITVIVPFYSDQTMRFINVEVSLVSFDTIDVKTEKDCQATERRWAYRSFRRGRGRSPAQTPSPYLRRRVRRTSPRGRSCPRSRPR